MKNYKFKIKNPGTLLLLLHFSFFILHCSAQTPVLFPLAQMTGTTNDTTITVRPVINPIKFHSQIYWLPTAGIQLATKNGSATTNLIPNDYNVTIAGVPGSWKISVSDTSVTLNAAEIGNLTVYSANGPLPGVLKINAGNNITISPPDGMGVVTINSTGGGGAATNGFLSQAGNRLITISTNLTDLIYTFSGVSQTNGYPWGVFYDDAGAAQAATNGLSITNGLSAFRSTNSFDAAGRATAATNGLSLVSGLAAFRGTNTFASTNVATASTPGLVKVDNSTITVASDGTISATTGGGGSVTSVALSTPGEFSVSGSPVTTSGTLSITRTADANFLGFGATNIGFIRVTNAANISGQATISTLIVTNGFTNQALTASTLLQADANKKLSSIVNGTGALTNDAGGNFGYAPLLDASALKTNQFVITDGSTNLQSTLNAQSVGLTNTIAWTHEGTATNITATFNGTLQSATITNGPTVFFSYAGANGSVSYRIFSTNFTTLQFAYQPKWLFGSNSVITNGVLSLTSYGGTNAAQLEAAMKENQ